MFVIVKNDVVVGCCGCCSHADAMIFSCLDSDRFKKRAGALSDPHKLSLVDR